MIGAIRTSRAATTCAGTMAVKVAVDHGAEAVVAGEAVAVAVEDDRR